MQTLQELHNGTKTVRIRSRYRGPGAAGILNAFVPSKLNCPLIVPATALTLTTVRTAAQPPYTAGAQATVVADVQALLRHASATVIEAVAVGLAAPKLNPLIVTVPPPPVGAALAEVAKIVLTTGAAFAINSCSG
jgi:hypothetical protein